METDMEEEGLFDMLELSPRRQWAAGLSAIEDFFSDPPLEHIGDSADVRSVQHQVPATDKEDRSIQATADAQLSNNTAYDEHRQRTPELEAESEGIVADKFATLLEDIDDVEGVPGNEDVQLPDANNALTPESTSALPAVPNHTSHVPAPSPTDSAWDKRSVSPGASAEDQQRQTSRHTPIQIVLKTPALPLRTSPRCIDVEQQSRTTPTVQEALLQQQSTRELEVPLRVIHPGHPSVLSSSSADPLPSSPTAGPPAAAADVPRMASSIGANEAPVRVDQAMLIPLADEDLVPEVLKTTDNDKPDHRQDIAGSETHVALEDGMDEDQAHISIEEEQTPTHKTQAGRDADMTMAEAQSPSVKAHEDQERDTQATSLVASATPISVTMTEPDTPMPSMPPEDHPQPPVQKPKGRPGAKTARTANAAVSTNDKPTQTKRKTKSAQKSEESNMTLQHQRLSSVSSPALSSQKSPSPKASKIRLKASPQTAPTDQDDSGMNDRSEMSETPASEPPRKKAKLNSTKGDIKQLFIDSTTKTIDTKTKGRTTRNKYKEVQAAQPSGAAAAKRRHQAK